MRNDLLSSTAPAPAQPEPLETQQAASESIAPAKRRAALANDRRPRRARASKAHGARGPPSEPEEDDDPPPDPDALAFSIKSFCKLHSISNAYYFLLRERGLAPREMCIGNRVLISREAASDWRAEREVATTEAKSERLRAAAPDLADLVVDGRMKLDEAMAAIKARNAAAERQQHAE